MKIPLTNDNFLFPIKVNKLFSNFQFLPDKIGRQTDNVSIQTII